MTSQIAPRAVRANASQLTFSKLTDGVNNALVRSVEEEYPELGEVHSTYQWFSRANFENARRYYLALGIANQQGRGDQVTLFGGAIVDLWHRDRAERACAYVGSGVRPKRVTELPHNVVRGSWTFVLKLTQVQAFDRQIPHQVMAAVSRLYSLTQDAPDALTLGTYVALSNRLKDPLLYAQYGAWLVLLAVWE